MSDTLSTIKAFATAPTKLVILKDGNGGEHEFTMRRFVRQGDYDAVQKKFDGRDNFLKAKKGKLPIDKVAPELLEGLTDFFWCGHALNCPFPCQRCRGVRPLYSISFRRGMMLKAEGCSGR